MFRAMSRARPGHRLEFVLVSLLRVDPPGDGSVVGFVASPATVCTRVVRTSFLALSSASSVRAELGCRVKSQGPTHRTKRTTMVAATPASAHSNGLGVRCHHFAMVLPELHNLAAVWGRRALVTPHLGAPPQAVDNTVT
jgi:hypothetical protein